MHPSVSLSLLANESLAISGTSPTPLLYFNLSLRVEPADIEFQFSGSELPP